SRAMPSIGAGLCAEIDDTAGELAPLGAQIVVLDLEFRNRVLRGNHKRQVDVADVERLAIQVLGAFVRERPSNLVIGKVERVLADGATGCVSLGHYGGWNRRQGIDISSIQRQCMCLALLDLLA